MVDGGKTDGLEGRKGVDGQKRKIEGDKNKQQWIGRSKKCKLRHSLDARK